MSDENAIPATDAKCIRCNELQTVRGGDVHCSGDCDDAFHDQRGGCHRFVAPSDLPHVDDLPYNAVSINGRAMEWKGPLWAAVQRWHEAVLNSSIGRVEAVVDTEAAVETAMRLALECRRDVDAKVIAELRVAAIAPEVWRDNDHWIAEIDYCAQGTTREEVTARFIEGWRLTVAERGKAGFYANDGAELAATFNRRFDEELALSRLVGETLDRHGAGHCASTTEQYRTLCALLAEQQAVLGPKLECGRYAVEHSRCEASDDEVLSVYCPGDADDYENVGTHGVTPEYTAWRAAREQR